MIKLSMICDNPLQNKPPAGETQCYTTIGDHPSVTTAEPLRGVDELRAKALAAGWWLSAGRSICPACVDRVPF